ncbi:MAG: M13 family metallopeptidase, partial [Verrucomicrobiota bacterium]|nr:M13 family metallopeptidase [Verrucomicrobiota bacterium]
MIKTVLYYSFGVFCAATLLAQSEPGSSPASPATSQNPPPIAATPAAATAPVDQPDVVKNPPALNPANMDTSVKPQDDFFAYANGSWMKNNPIPPEYSRWGSFNELIEKNNEALREIAEKADKLAPQAAGESKIEKAAGSEIQKVGDFYASGMNEEAINQAKAEPLQEELKRIDEIKDLSTLTEEIGHLHSMGVTAFFAFTSGQDDKDSTKVIAQAFQGGLGLPDRDYYTKDDDASKKLRDQYVAHVTRMFTLLGDSPEASAANARTVLEVETSLAKPARTRVELRDPQKNYNKMSKAELQKLMPNFKWDTYLQQIGLTAPAAVNVGQPDFFRAANAVFKSVSLDQWKTYLRWHLVNDSAPMLSQDFVDENFAFYGKTLSGTEKLKPRWKRVVAAIDNEVGEALGKLYVADHFPPEAKKRALEMVNNLKAALADRIKTNDWMDEATQK